jgi:dihydroorotase
MQTLTIPAVDDFHVHLRQGSMMHAVTPLVYAGGVRRCAVMPNTVPPIDSVEAAMDYRAQLRQIDPRVQFLMTICLHDKLTPTDIAGAKAAGIFGIKLYPRGVTTNSDNGVEDLCAYDELFDAMAENGLPLLIHGEVPSNPQLDICVMNAEQRFLPELQRIHRRFPRLKIVLEHLSSAAAVECVKSLGDTVAATITAHHLELTVDDWAGNSLNFCKPPAKKAGDREALRSVVAEGHPRFFLGSDSAPHPRSAKTGAIAKAGIFTTPLLLPYLADSFELIG